MLMKLKSIIKSIKLIFGIFVLFFIFLIFPIFFRTSLPFFGLAFFIVTVIVLIIHYKTGNKGLLKSIFIISILFVLVHFIKFPECHSWGFFSRITKDCTCIGIQKISFGIMDASWSECIGIITKRFIEGDQDKCSNINASFIENSNSIYVNTPCFNNNTFNFTIKNTGNADIDGVKWDSQYNYHHIDSKKYTKILMGESRNFEIPLDDVPRQLKIYLIKSNSDEEVICSTPNLHKEYEMCKTWNETLNEQLIENKQIEATIPPEPDIVVKEGELVDVIKSLNLIDTEDTKFRFSKPLDQYGKWQTLKGDAGNYEIVVIAYNEDSEVRKELLLRVKKMNN